MAGSTPDVGIDELKAKAWITDVNKELIAVEHLLLQARNAKNTAPGEKDTVFLMVEKVGTLMEETWNTTCGAFKKGWGILEDGLGVLGEAGSTIESAFSELTSQINR